MVRRCVIIGAGEVADLNMLQLQIRDNDYIICVDNGYYYAQKIGIKPDLILGDFDSYKGELPKSDNVRKYNPEKDDSDTLLALKTAIENGYRKILLLGMLGGRLDHTYANIQAAVYSAKRGIDLLIWDKDNTVRAVDSKEIEIAPIEGHMISVFSANEVSYGVCIKNAKYLLEDYTLKNDIPLGLSNEFIPKKPMKISVREGVLVIITSKKN